MHLAVQNTFGIGTSLTNSDQGFVYSTHQNCEFPWGEKG